MNQKAAFYSSKRFIFLLLGGINAVVGWLPLLEASQMPVISRTLITLNPLLYLFLFLVYWRWPRLEPLYVWGNAVLSVVMPLLLITLDLLNHPDNLDVTSHVIYIPLFYITTLIFLGLKRGLVATGMVFVGASTLLLSHYLPHVAELQGLQLVYFKMVIKFCIASLMGIAFLTAMTLFNENQVRGRVTAELTAELALKDTLTGLDSRKLFHERLEGALLRAQRNRESFVVMFIDLDYFKQVNDRFGHQAGDEVLRQFADRIRQAVRKSDAVARLSGDEFAIIAHEAGLEDATLLGDKIMASLEAPLTVLGEPHPASASIGISVYQEHGKTASALLVAADQAMYQSKIHGRGRYTVYCADAQQGSEGISRTVLERELQHAVEQKAIHLHYQPIYQGEGQDLVGMEALARWNHPTLGWVPPEVFIPVAEDTGVVVELGRQLLLEACTHNKRWEERGLVVSVNVSPVQFNRSDFVQTVQQVLQWTGLPAHLLELELTERTVLHEGARESLQALQSLGVRVSLDDFGSGYSSLSRLQDLPISGFKIDRKFIQDITGRDPLKGSRQLIQVVVQLARVMNLKVVAEGVETQVQLETVLGSGCECIQGHLLSDSLPPEQFERLLQKAEGGVVPFLGQA
ncbi:putative bifunctional diguanylate cyclase/phosphodiesterase [Deinococcus roseus]|uniref:GGDEF-domain containing protein n=1 Tax=Deinococcus roseus TaxID=392414 RepID=A0ABQ2DH64_9DEIO|nr:EAL domain-containing protein [Deinococcus roseus]GGJ56071.1 hypothetical protein GCM10008938_47780 [Deinococcus roseus]